MTAPPSWIQAALTLLVLVAAVIDVRTRRIPNWLSGAGIVAGFGLQGALRGWSGLGEAAMGAGLAFLVYFLLFALRAMGGGDVKLMMAVGALAGVSNWFTIFILASISGGIIALILIGFHGTLRPTAANIGFLLRQLVRFHVPYRANPVLDVSHPKAVTLPHGLSIAVGTILFLVLANAS